MTLTLPYPPLLNHIYRRTARGVFLAPKAAAYKAEIAALFPAWQQAPTDALCALTVRVYRPQKRGDVDGVLKLLLDSLQGILYHNDDQVVELHVYRYDAGSRSAARVEVEIEDVG